jgi:hypothetical protein
LSQDDDIDEDLEFETDSDKNMMETFEEDRSVPLNFQFLNLDQIVPGEDDLDAYEEKEEDPEEGMYKNGEPVKLELRSEIPIDAHLVHIQTEEGGLMKIADDGDVIETMPGTEKDIPLNFGFVHLQNEEGDDVMRYI